MSNHILSIEFEEMMKNISDIPEADEAFMTAMRARFISKGVSSAVKNRMNKKLVRTRMSPRRRGSRLFPARWPSDRWPEVSEVAAQAT